MTIKGIDIASHQGADFPFAQAKAQGFEFVVIKASGGHDYKNPYRAQQAQSARDAGMLVGWYHYMFEPSSGGGVDEREFANLKGALDGLWQPGDTIWLDVEEYPATVGYSGGMGDWIVAFCDRVEATFGIVPGIYCATWYLVPTGLSKDTRLRKYPFWMASWQDALPPRSTMAPWDTVTLWQFDATYTGLTGAHLDCDQFGGSREDLLALGTPQVAAAIIVPNSIPYGPYGKHLGGGFRKTYEDAGANALSLYGFPVTDEITENGITVQYFERARFEYHADTGAITFGRVGAELARLRGLSEAA